jgi:hypothetical protein
MSADGWDAGLQQFTVKLERMGDGLLPAVASAAHTSIVDGSPLTGSPGQPVGQYGPGYHPGEVGGTLKASWQLRFPAKDVAEITTNEVYAPHNEYGVTADGRPYTQRSSIGGRHSVALTIAGLDRIVDAEAKRLMGAG